MSSNFDLAAPQPLQSLTQRVISPQNIALEARQRRAEPLSFRKRQELKREIKLIRRALRAGQFEELLSIKESLKAELLPLQERYSELKELLNDEPENAEALAQLEQLKEQIAPTLRKWNGLNTNLRPLQELAQKAQDYQHMLEDHPVAVARIKEENRLRRALEKEAEIYAGLIVTRWDRLGFNHKYTEKGKEKTHHVKFSNISITLDGIYYKIAASHKTAFNNWVMDIPQGVYIAKQLLSPETLQELSIACQKQVTGVYNSDGAWVIVHRLESVDGLMNYVSYSDVMERYPHQYKNRMPIPVGVSYNREIQWVNLGDYPHWLIGGYTGSGKSNTINVGLCSLISSQSPEDLRLVLIDLKGGLEFNFYENIPHLHGQIVDEPPKVADTLNELESIMELRFKQFKGVAKKLEEYHVKRPQKPMPRILCVFDEVASIQGEGDTTKRIVASLSNLSRRGRAVGIHLWLCTQQPNVKVIEGSIKTNMNFRLSGRMPSSSDSITVLGNSSAAQLASIAGRMIMQPGADPIPVQTPHISNDEIAKALTTAKEYQQPQPLELGDVKRMINQQWTPEHIIRFSLTHMNGLVSGRRLWDAIGDDSLTLMQANKLAEQVWKMSPIEQDGKIYTIQARRGNAKYLVELQPQDAKIQDTQHVSIDAPLVES